MPGMHVGRAVVAVLFACVAMNVLICSGVAAPSLAPQQRHPSPPEGWEAGRMFPSFLVIGEQKCGTTSLHMWMEKHPFVVHPYGKELCNLMTHPLQSNASSVAQWWRDYQLKFRRRTWATAIWKSGMFAKAPRVENFKGIQWPASFQPKQRLSLQMLQSWESCTHYLLSSTAHDNIVQRLQNHTKLIVLVRDPVTRMISALLHHEKRRGRMFWELATKALNEYSEDLKPLLGNESSLWDDSASDGRPHLTPTQLKQTSSPLRLAILATLHGFLQRCGGVSYDPVSGKPEFVGECSSIVRRGFYAANLDRLVAAGWPREDVLVVVMEEMARSPLQQLHRIEEYVGLLPFSGYSQLGFAYNKSSNSSTALLQSMPDLILKLRSLFASDTERLWTRYLGREWTGNWPFEASE